MGHGEDRPKSATNAVKVDDLENFKIRGISCGLGQTLIIIDRDDPKFNDLPVIGDLLDLPEKRGRSKSPVRSKSKSPVRSSSKSPVRSKSKSPVRSSSKSPVRSKSKSPVRSSSKSPVRSKSKSPVRSNSPAKRKADEEHSPRPKK